MNKIFLLSALFLGVSAHAQREVLGLYDISKQTITLKYYTNYFHTELDTPVVSFPIGYFNAFPVSNPYFSKGACQAMQLSSNNHLYFFLMDRLAEPSAAGWTACFDYDIKSKKTTKLFPVSRQPYLIWRLLETRQSIVYYDQKSGSFIEKPLTGKNYDTLAHIEFDPFESHLEADETGLHLYAVQGDEAIRWDYSFDSRKATLTKLAPAGHLCGARKEKLVITMPPKTSTTMQLLGGSRIVTKNLPITTPTVYWVNEDHFGINEAHAVSLYKDDMNLVTSYSVEKATILCSVAKGVLISYVDGDHRAVSYLNENFSAEHVLNNIRSHTIYMVAEIR